MDYQKNIEHFKSGKLTHLVVKTILSQTDYFSNWKVSMHLSLFSQQDGPVITVVTDVRVECLANVRVAPRLVVIAMLAGKQSIMA